ncbi:Crp/Fnr family transcriptional regulator [Nocardiopsis sp. Huas11]|uniref:Crp/Fnr family transcriptional regulator n=1 Tax=Nocardiopsis sp. Huas11 TaxID=2183912 RepID=UPI001F1FC787|nr:Crp/Fnr family transcriptional regulator [Nocardiopsis sp. Huas11]
MESERLRWAEWTLSCLGNRGSARPGHRELVALASCLESRSLQRGDLAFGEGAQDAGVWIVRSGRLELAVKGQERPVILQILRAGGIDGDIQVLLRVPFTYRARALESSECLTLTADAFDGLLAKHPVIARLWMSGMAERLSLSYDRIVGMLSRSLSQQSARLLLDESHAGAVEVPQRTLSEMLGVCRPSLNKVLKEFERLGLIRLRYGAVDILDRYGLARRAD